MTNIFFLLCYQTLQIFFYVQGSFLVLKGQKKTTNMKWLKNILASITDDISMNIGSVIGPKVHPEFLLQATAKIPNMQFVLKVVWPLLSFITQVTGNNR